MTRREEYQTTILTIYESCKNFIKMSKRYGLRKEYLEVLVNEYFELYDILLLCAIRDDFITAGHYNELLDYVDKLSNYLKECLE